MIGMGAPRVSFQIEVTAIADAASIGQGLISGQARLAAVIARFKRAIQYAAAERWALPAFPCGR
jgi:hypothetical protein